MIRWDESSTLGFIAPVCPKSHVRKMMKPSQVYTQTPSFNGDVFMYKCMCMRVFFYSCWVRQWSRMQLCVYSEDRKTELISIDRSILITNCLEHVWPTDRWALSFLSISDMPLSFLHLLQSFIVFIGSVCKFSHIIDIILWTSFTLRTISFRSFSWSRTILSD